MSLKTGHLFPLLRLIRALNIREDLRKLFTDATGKSEEEQEQLARQRGFEAIYLLLERLPDAEQEAKEFIGAITGKTPAEVDDMPIDEMINAVRSVRTPEVMRLFFKRG